MAMIKRNGRVIVVFGLLFAAVLAVGTIFARSLTVAAGAWGLCFQ